MTYTEDEDKPVGLLGYGAGVRIVAFVSVTILFTAIALCVRALLRLTAKTYFANITD